MTLTGSLPTPPNVTSVLPDRTPVLERVANGNFSALPFVKWVGGKRSLAPTIATYAPRRFTRYVEPFLGGGAMALALGLEGMLLNDANSELINAFTVIQDSLVALCEELTHLREQHSEAFYYTVRARRFESLTAVEQAARFIYLNKTGFNGLYRVNRRGEFNVPFGRHANPGVFEAAMLRHISDVVGGSQLHNLHYLTFLERHVQPGDLVYLDPPYIPVSQYSDFKRYTPDQFREADQIRLAQAYDDLIELGAYPILSNSAAPLALELYARHQIYTVRMRRSLNSDGGGRGEINEILVLPKTKGSQWH
jgi:DNA adenine methylase